MVEDFFLTRHARPARDAKEGDPVSEKYPDITEGGVEQAKDRAQREIADLVRAAPENGIVFIGGSSDQPRTKQTAEIYGDALSASKDELGAGVLVITKKEIDALVPDTSPEATDKKGFKLGRIAGTVRKLQKMIAEHKGKVVIDYPLMLNELSFGYKNRWTDEDGNKTEYFNELLKKHNQNHAVAGEEWLAGQTLEVNGKKLHGPNPTQIAEDYIHGLQRLRQFVEKTFPGRPVIIGEVGHQWDLDAVVVYLANGGKVDIEGFKKVSQGQGTAKEAEIVQVSIDAEQTRVRYRGKDFVSSKIS